MIRYYFGSPGAGKTTTAVRNMRLMARKKIRPKRIFANFETKDLPYVTECDTVDLGKWTFPKYSHVYLDEAGIDYNNRKFKSMLQETIAWYKKHRHFRVDVDIYSQSWEDVDITLRRLSYELWYIKKVGPFTLCRLIKKFVDIDDERHEIVDGYRFAKLLRRFLPWPFKEKTWYFVFRPFHYRFFDSYDCPDIPVRYADTPENVPPSDWWWYRLKNSEKPKSALRLLANRLSLVCSSVKRALRVASHRPANAGDQPTVEDEKNNPSRS